MKTVFKYPVPLNGVKFSHLIPLDFKFRRLSPQGHNGDLFMWLEVNTDMPKIQVDFEFFGTGHEIPVNSVYMATIDKGPFVLHLYRL